MITKPRNRVTLKDISKACGYSVTTISRALRGDSALPEATRRKIRETAASLGYIRNSAASSLRSGHSNIIAVIVEDIKNSHYSSLIDEMDRQLRQHGYVTMVLSTHGSLLLEHQMVLHAVSNNVDAIILFPLQDDRESVSYLEHLSTPLLLIDRGVDGISCDQVMIDDCAVGKLAAASLLSRCAPPYMYIAGPEYNRSEHARRSGFLDTLRAAGVLEHQVRILPHEKMTDAIDHGTVLDLLTPVTCSGIFCFNDDFAYQVFYALAMHGYRVPGDVSVIGVDHVRQHFRYLPPLSSIGQVQENNMADCAVQLLLGRLQNPDSQISVKVLPVALFDENATA